MIGTALLVAMSLGGPPADPIETGYASAEQRWGPMPCEVAVTREDLPDNVGGVASFSTPGPTDCKVALDVALRGEILCAVAKHEFGHIAGQDHSPDPRDVMHSPLSMIPRQCRR